MSSLSSQDVSRGQNALQRRALQLKRWQEIDQSEALTHNSNDKREPKVKFSSATLFLSAVAQNDVHECERLLLSSRDLDVNATTGDGLTALHQMAIDDNLEMCRWLLKHDADVNCRDNEGWTPLHAAASCGHFEIVKLLLSREECDVFAINCDGELARDVCDGDDCLRLIDDRMRRLMDIKDDDDSEEGIPEELLKEIRSKELKSIEKDFKEFLQRNPLITEKSVFDWIEKTRDLQSGATVLHVCSAKGYSQQLETILEKISSKLTTIDVFIDNDGFTALHSSAFWRQINCFEILLKFGANFELKTKDSRDIADLCHENTKIMDLICETKKSRELKAKNDLLVEELTTATKETSAETQRKLNAKRQRETRRSTQGITKEDIEMALKTTNVEEPSQAPPMPSSPPPVVPLSPSPTTVVSLTPPSVNCISTTVSVPLYPQRRRQKRRSTGIDDLNVGEVAPTDDNTTQETTDCVDSPKTILSTTSSSPTTTTTTVAPPPPLTTRSRSSSRSSVGQTTDDDELSDTKSLKKSSEVELDYKKLYLELLKENEFLIRKLKEIDHKKDDLQDFQREKRQLLRRISELEEELKQKEELAKDNQRLKDENSALIRVISKLSK